jgi:hypothetical protein
MNSPETHLAAAGDAQATERPCDYCGALFKPSRDWSRFCRGRGNGCRNDFHAREARKEAIRARALVMYECLADFASQGNQAAAEAIKDLKAP